MLYVDEVTGKLKGYGDVWAESERENRERVGILGKSEKQTKESERRLYVKPGGGFNLY